MSFPKYFVPDFPRFCDLLNREGSNPDTIMARYRKAEILIGDPRTVELIGLYLSRKPEDYMKFTEIVLNHIFDKNRNADGKA